MISQKGFPAKPAGAKGMRYFRLVAKKTEAIIGILSLGFYIVWMNEWIM